jgi:hypothetical protein
MAHPEVGRTGSRRKGPYPWVGMTIRLARSECASATISPAGSPDNTIRRTFIFRNSSGRKLARSPPAAGQKGIGTCVTQQDSFCPREAPSLEFLCSPSARLSARNHAQGPSSCVSASPLPWIRPPRAHLNRTRDSPPPGRGTDENDLTIFTRRPRVSLLSFR